MDAIKALKLSGKILFVGETSNEFVALAVRNLAKVSYVTRDQLSAIDVIKADYIMLAQPTITKIEEVLQ